MGVRSPLVLAIDQGTTNSKALVIDQGGAIQATASRSVPITYPRLGWVEQDPWKVWTSVARAIDEALAEVKQVPEVLAITNQRESALIWERSSGEPVGPLVSWQCRRSSPLCEELRSAGAEEEVRARTGLFLDPLFSAGKVRWLLDNVSRARALAERGDLCFGTVDSWLLWNLTSGGIHATDASNAARTQLFDIFDLSWSDELLDLFSVPPGILPELRPSSGIFGRTVPVGELPGGIPIAAMIGDSHAALFGHGCHRPGGVKATYGTGSSLMSVTAGPVPPIRGLGTTIAWMRDRATYALEGNISATGAAIEWLAEILGLEGAGAVEELAREAIDSGGVYLVPAFVGLGAPHWDPEARGLIVGLTRGTRSSHLARAVLEAVAFQVRDVLDALIRRDGGDSQVLYADGGASQSDLLMQMQADLTGWSVARAATPHLAALGAAYLAGLAVGVWGEDDVVALIRHSDRFEPALDSVDRDRLYAGWRDAVGRALHRNPMDACRSTREEDRQDVKAT